MFAVHILPEMVKTKKKKKLKAGRAPSSLSRDQASSPASSVIESKSQAIVASSNKPHFHSSASVLETQDAERDEKHEIADDVDLQEAKVTVESQKQNQKYQVWTFDSLFDLFSFASLL